MKNGDIPLLSICALCGQGNLYIFMIFYDKEELFSLTALKCLGFAVVTAALSCGVATGLFKYHVYGTVHSPTDAHLLKV